APRLLEFKNFYTQPINSRFVLTCNKLDGVAPLKFLWTKNGQSISQTPDSRIKIDVYDDFSMFMIKNIQIVDAGNYSCIVQNPYGIDSQWSMLQIKGRFMHCCIEVNFCCQCFDFGNVDNVSNICFVKFFHLCCTCSRST
ncbi:Immunoglobulin-like protein, partial [Euroglyphus maynei]